MKKFLYLLLATAMLATFGCTGDTNSNTLVDPRGTAWTPKGEITGYLFDKPNHTPIAGAKISVAGVSAVETKADGSFLIKKVPANTYVDGNGQIQRDDNYDAYTVVVDMTKVNDAIAAANLKNKTNNPLYPQYKTTSVRVKFTDLGETNSDTRANESVPTTTNGNTPVNGFRASLFEDLAVGKLSGAVALQILEPVQGKPFTAGTVSVRLSSNGSDNSGTGDFYNQVTAPKTTDADGYVFFDALEIGQDFTVFATAVANGRTYELRVNRKQLTNRVVTKGEFVAVWYATTINTAKIPATTVTNSNLHIGGPFYLEDVTERADVSDPFVSGTTPLEMSDIVATEGTAQQVVTITFNEPINANTNYAQALTEQQASIAGLWNDVYVRYDGPKKGAKSGNIAHTIEWDATSGTLATGFTRLLVKFDTMPGSKYTVAIVKPRDTVNPTLDSEDFALEDMAGNDLDYETGRLFNDGYRFRRAAARVSFTTSYDDYNETPLATPVPLRVGDSTLVRWAAIDGSTVYKVFVERFIDGNGSGKVLVKETPFAQYDVSEVGDFFNTSWPFETGEQKITYMVYVVAYNPSRAESAFGAANELVDDQSVPFVSSTSGTFPVVGTVVPASGPTGSVTGTFVLSFDKQLYNVLGAAEVVTKWTGAITAAPTAGSLTFAANTVTYNPDPDNDVDTQGSSLTVTWTITNSNAAAQTISSYTLSSTAVSLNGIEIGQYYSAP